MISNRTELSLKSLFRAEAPQLWMDLNQHKLLKEENVKPLSFFFGPLKIHLLTWPKKSFCFVFVRVGLVLVEDNQSRASSL